MIRKTIEDVLRDGNRKMIIDLRRREDYKKETIPGAIHVYHGDLRRKLSLLPRDTRIYLFCYTGETSDGLAEELAQKGYEIYSIEGGFHSYLRYKLKQMMP